jgi:hypothetical protein
MLKYGAECWSTIPSVFTVSTDLASLHGMSVYWRNTRNLQTLFLLDWDNVKRFNAGRTTQLAYGFRGLPPSASVWAVSEFICEMSGRARAWLVSRNKQ